MALSSHVFSVIDWTLATQEDSQVLPALVFRLLSFMQYLRNSTALHSSQIYPN